MTAFSLFIIACASDSEPARSGEARQFVIGGDDASDLAESTGQVELINPKNGLSKHCGGTLLGGMNDRWVLTAAHCVRDLFGEVDQGCGAGGGSARDYVLDDSVQSSLVRVRLGARTSDVDLIRIHHGFPIKMNSICGATRTYDAALLRLRDPLNPQGESGWRQLSDSIPMLSSMLTCYGYGRSVPNADDTIGVLRTASLRVQSHQDTGYLLSPNGRGQMMAYADSGSACFMSNGTIAGVQSWTLDQDKCSDCVGYQVAASNLRTWVSVAEPAGSITLTSPTPSAILRDVVILGSHVVETATKVTYLVEQPNMNVLGTAALPLYQFHWNTRQFFNGANVIRARAEWPGGGYRIVRVPVRVANVPIELKPEGQIPTTYDTTLSFSTVKGAKSYSVCIMDSTNGPSPTCPQTDVEGCQIILGTSRSVLVQSGHSYTWCVRAIDADGYRSDAASATFVVADESPCGDGYCIGTESGASCPQDCCDASTPCDQTFGDQGAAYCRRMNGGPWEWLTPDQYNQYCDEPQELCSATAQCANVHTVCRDIQSSPHWSSESCSCGDGLCAGGETGSSCPQDCCDEAVSCDQTYVNQGGAYCRRMNGGPWEWLTPDQYNQYCDEPQELCLSTAQCAEVHTVCRNIEYSPHWAPPASCP